MAPKETPTPGRAGALSFRTVALLMALLGVAVAALLGALYVRFVRYEARAAAHVPPDAVLAVRLDVGQAVLYEPVRKHLLPLLGDPSGSREAGDARLGALEAASGLERGDLRELLVSRGPAPDDLALVLSGLFASGETEARALVVALNERTPAFEARPEPAIATHRETGTAAGLAPDGSVVIAADPARLAAARAGSDWASRHGLAAGGIGGAVALAPALSQIATAVPALAALGELSVVRGHFTLTERFEVTLDLEDGGGRGGGAGAAARAVLAWLDGAARREPGSTFLPSALRRARLETPSQAGGTARLHLVWEREELGPAAAALAESIRARFRALPAGAVLTGPLP